MKKITLFMMALLVSVASMAESYSTIAEVKAITGKSVPVTLTSPNAVVTFFTTDGIIIEDASGAIKCQSYYWASEEAKGLVPGKKITSVSGYANYEGVEYDWWGDSIGTIEYPGVIYNPEDEALTYTLGDSVGVTYVTATAAELIANYKGYEYKAVKIAKTAIISDKSGNPAIAAGTDTTLALYYNGKLPGEAVLYGYYGPHPYGESRGTVINVIEDRKSVV